MAPENEGSPIKMNRNVKTAYVNRMWQLVFNSFFFNRLHDRQAFHTIARNNCPAVFNAFIPNKNDEK